MFIDCFGEATKDLPTWVPSARTRVYHLVRIPYAEK